ncbi:MAG: winged helix DNA-binding domain-containing protein, partial [Actinomycetota bacterium]
ARRLVAVHSTDPSSVYLAMLTRLAAGDIATVERALYEDRVLLRLLAMRRTVFVTTPDTAAVALAGAGRAVAARERRKLIAMLAGNGVPDPERWLAGTQKAVLSALAARGEATAAELAGDDPRLATQIVLSPGTNWEGRQNVASRLLLVLAAEGQVIRGRPRGSWTSHQYRWSVLTTWYPDGLDEWTPEAAEAELARRWLLAYGPATAEDLRWWAGWTKTQLKRALTQVQPAEVDLDGVPGLVLADDLEPVAAAEPWAALLPGLDSTPMGWHDRDWFLGGHGPRLFDRAGNVGPTLWWDGRIVGGWAQSSSGEIVCRFLEDAGSQAVAAVDAAAQRLAASIGDVRLTARTRGRTWLETELAD